VSVEIIYKRGDPKTTQFMKQLQIIWGLIEVTTKYYVTATHWADIHAELDAQYSDPSGMMDPTRPPPWKQRPNMPMKFGLKEPFLYVINSGTDDDQVVNLLNNEAPMVEAFGKKRDALRTG
jgi:hypothetical protein